MSWLVVGTLVLGEGVEVAYVSPWEGILAMMTHSVLYCQVTSLFIVISICVCLSVFLSIYLS